MGSILAAVGTALPETLVPDHRHRLHRRRDGAEQVGIGAILGAPFMLASLAMVVTGGRGRRCSTGAAGARWRSRSTRASCAATSATSSSPTRWPWSRRSSTCGALHYGLAAGLHALLRLLRVGDAPAPRATSARTPSRCTSTAHPEMPHTHRIFLQIGVAIARHHPRRRDLREARSRCSARRSGPPADRLAAHHADRHRAAGEVQLRALDPRAQGHARAGQHHGRDGVPEHVPGVDRPHLHDLAAHQRGAGRRACWRCSAAPSST